MKINAHLIALALCVLAIAGSAQSPVTADFRSVVEKRLAKDRLKLADVCPVDSNPVAFRVFQEYGAMFVSSSDVKYPSKCVFENEKQVTDFQAKVKTKTLRVGNTTVELQSAAMDALIKARAAAARRGLSISPRGGSTSSKRGYGDTHRIWISRFEPALKHWTARGAISAAAANRARQMATIDQVVQVMEWEKNRWWFSTGFNRTIFSSVAAPGTSQHLAMLALDVAEFGNVKVREILNDHGWYQTIANDTPHFTYLGVHQDELPKRGLRLEFSGQFSFWVPNFPSAVPPKR